MLIAGHKELKQGQEDIKNVLAHNIADTSQCPPACGVCPPEGYNGACCHGGTKCETQNWTPQTCIPPYGTWCGASKPEKPPTYTVSNSEMQTGTVNCHAGDAALSCGIAPQLLNPGRDYDWQAWPISNSSCQCKDNYGDICTAVCATPQAIDGSSLQIVSSQCGAQGTSATASCPPGHVATGCGVKLSGTESWPDAYPNSETSCKCYDYYGCNCAATCAPASSVTNHTIVSQYGTGNFDVQCPAGTFALGCGFQDKVKSGKAEYQPHFFANEDGTSCRCYNFFGTTCYGKTLAPYCNYCMTSTDI
jgi:hypothetical protein